MTDLSHRIIQVTQEHIEFGIPESCSECPVAKAIRATGLLEEGDEAFVEKTQVLTLDRQYLLPEEVQEWIEQFDSNSSVDPITFTLGEGVLTLHTERKCP